MVQSGLQDPWNPERVAELLEQRSSEDGPQHIGVAWLRRIWGQLRVEQVLWAASLISVWVSLPHGASAVLTLPSLIPIFCLSSGPFSRLTSTHSVVLCTFLAMISPHLFSYDLTPRSTHGTLHSQ